ncbi:MAG: MBOAT family protein [Acidimicrobiales bacterium]|nr:MBOAT family protein [Acidimicrobiales bacterium]
MTFTSFAYAGFLTVVAGLYWVAPRRARPPLLLVASYVFYASWSASATVILAAVTAVVFLAAPAIERSEGARRTAITGGAVVAAAASLLVLKTVEALGLTTDASQSFAVPVGLSFFSFHAISYLVDVHRGTTAARRDPIDVALYLSFFPHLLAGPVVRSHKLIGAFHQVDRRPDGVRMAEAAELLLVGTFKKVVVADPVLVTSGAVLADASHAGTVEVALALVATLVAAYFDVTGYIDIARGSAKVLGIDMPRNNLLPLLRSSSYADFWRRWQLTIMAWFRDYVYRPLRGDRRDGIREYLALAATFFFLGVWHGLSAGWILWGLVSGAIIVAERVRQSRRAVRRRRQVARARRARDRSLLPRPPSAVASLASALGLVLATMPLVVVSSLDDSLDVYGALLGFRGGPVSVALAWYLAAALVALVVVDRREERREARAGRRDPVTLARAIAFGVYLLAIVVSAGPASRSFIYFAF